MNSTAAIFDLNALEVKKNPPKLPSHTNAESSGNSLLIIKQLTRNYTRDYTMLFTGAVESADGLVSSCGNHTDIRSIVPKCPKADVTNASPFDHCLHRCCFPFAEQPTVSQPEKHELYVSSTTPLLCSSSWSMKDLIKPLMWQPC